MTAATLPARRQPHIVDVLIAERAPRLTASPLWPVVRPALYGVLGYGAAVRMADAIRDLSGTETFGYVSDLLRLKVTTMNLDRLPASGRCVVVCNHPTGIADGVAVFDAIKQRRSDMIFFANADAIRVSPRLDETIIPVEWVHDKRTREKTRATLNAAKEAFEAERCVVMFPAGRLAREKNRVLTDPEWAPTAASMARKYDAPVVPMHVTGPYSRLFHLFDKVSQELRDVTLFHELLNKEGKPFGVDVGLPIPADRLDVDAAKATEALKTFTERTLAADPDAVFP
ncbi:MAG: putative hemolysin [Brevundimonas sp.]|jgi:putative hemolysin|uniref:GNAT family N-acetyltransferase n=1 Tax=Brevundimonas sp. GW460-12-10-14-LB2 TaxID=1827469 RepID=UPI0007BC9765|nr:1-acyl-sn-glycerol-3-phosphate acyltransferase [Brevundimonas sp. GW460-12-10-14-LB2]ANC54175.1 acyltransferase [Brevundimonas sp. GW460-12-10-14-LB2]MEA3473775.1 1-acyl-sn-glycerol-3-phosphate acyltransferase [Pseudomonadota bacterium]